MSLEPKLPARLRVGILIDNKKIGGSERQAALLARELHRRGVHVTVYIAARPYRNCPAEEVDFSGLRTRYLWSGPFQRLGRRSLDRACLALLLRLGRIGLLHCFVLDTRETLRLPSAAGAAGIRAVVGGVRNIGFVEDSAYRGRLKIASRMLIGLTCNSRETARRLLGYGIVEPDRLHVIENGLEMPKRDDGESGRVERRREVLFAGRLTAVKDPLCFVRSAITLLKDGRPYRFVIAGDGALRHEILKLIEDAGVASAFKLPGVLRPETIPYHQARLLVNTSLSEGSSNAILEGLAHGIPVVATAVGGTKELLEGHSFASLVEPKNSGSLAAAIDYWLMLEDNQWRTASTQAREFVRARFGVSRMADQHCEFYRWALGTGQHSPARDAFPPLTARVS